MNLRTEPGGAVVELHGWLGEEVLADFDSLCESCPAPLRLDLSQLAGTDEAGRFALRQLAASGSKLEGASPYIRLLLADDGPASGPARREHLNLKETNR